MEQYRAYRFTSDKEVVGCNATVVSPYSEADVECRVDETNKTYFYVIYTPTDDDFFYRLEEIEVIAWDIDDYYSYAVLDLSVFNVASYIPLWSPIRIGTPEWVNIFFKCREDVEGHLWIVGIRFLTIILILICFSLVLIFYAKRGKKWS